MTASTDALLPVRYGWRRRTAWGLATDANISFQSVVDALPHLVFIARPDGRIEYRNQAWQAFTAHTPAADAYANLVHPDDEAAYLDSWNRAAATSTEVHCDLRLLDPQTGEPRRHLFHAVPLFAGSGPMWLCTSTDVARLHTQITPTPPPTTPAPAIAPHSPLIDGASAARARARLASLTERERELLDLLVSGCSNKQAARRLDISVKTVENHRAKIMRKMEVGNTAELVRLTVLAM